VTIDASDDHDRNGHQQDGEKAEDPSRADPPGIVREFIDFLKSNKRWWLTPIVIVTIFLVAAAWLLPSPVAPFIYSLF